MIGEIKYLRFAEGITVTSAALPNVSRKINVVLSAETTKNVNVSSIVTDARDCIWQLKKPSGDDYEQIQCKITTPDANTVSLDFGGFPKTGTFVLFGV